MRLHRVPADMFKFATEPRSPLYTAILHAFGEANEQLETSLSLDEVRRKLRSAGWLDDIDDDPLTSALEQLRAWSLLEISHNHAADYRTAADFERRNLNYALTKHGEAAFAGVQHALTMLSSTGALQTAVLDAIADRLDELFHLVTAGTSNDRRIFSTLSELEGHLEALRNNVTQFNNQLQRLMRADGAELETFYEVKTATVRYLEEFLTNLDQRARSIADAIARIEEHGVASLHERALRGAELSPLPGVDPRPQWLRHRQTRWNGLRSWFRPLDDSTPRVQQLHTVARRAIVALLQTLDRIVESRRHASSVAADFRELARWFATVHADDDLHRLWGTAFGLTSARHAHLAHPDPELIPTSSSWEDAEPVKVSALLRTAGKVERFSRIGKTRDVRELKEIRAQRAAAERHELTLAWQQLATSGQARLADFGTLEHATFQHLLQLIARALAMPINAHGIRRSSTSDGVIDIVLREPVDSEQAVILTEQGKLTAPNYRIEIRKRVSRSDA